MAELTMAEALNLAMRQEMAKDEDVVTLGQDIGVDGGIFRITDGLIEEFGEERVIDTPLAESAILGTAIGMSAYGLKPVAEIQFSGFSYLGYHQLESHAARLRWRSQGRYGPQMVMRAPYGGGVRALEHHSESREVIFAHTPGLKVVIPSGPRNARALLVSAIRDPDPVIFLEPKALYRSFREEVPDDEETMDIGRARRAREGGDLTLVAFGAMMPRVLEAADKLSEKDGIECDVVDLISISPLDVDLVSESVRRTGRLVIVHEAPRSFGPAGEITARVMEESFLYLEAPIERVTGFDTHFPLLAREQMYLPSADRIVAAARKTLEF